MSFFDEQMMQAVSTIILIVCGAGFICLFWLTLKSVFGNYEDKK